MRSLPPPSSSIAGDEWKGKNQLLTQCEYRKIWMNVKREKIDFKDGTKDEKNEDEMGQMISNGRSSECKEATVRSGAYI